MLSERFLEFHFLFIAATESRFTVRYGWYHQHQQHYGHPAGSFPPSVISDQHPLRSPPSLAVLPPDTKRCCRGAWISCNVPSKGDTEVPHLLLSNELAAGCRHTLFSGGCGGCQRRWRSNHSCISKPCAPYVCMPHIPILMMSELWDVEP